MNTDLGKDGERENAASRRVKRGKRRGSGTGRYGQLMSEHSMPHDLAAWACPHGQDARRGCTTCYEESNDGDPSQPSWEVAAWFTTSRPIPIRTLQDAHHHGRYFALDQPSTPLVYLLTGHARAAGSVQAIAGVVGFLLHNRHVVADFTVTETRATRRSPATPSAPKATRRTDTWLQNERRPDGRTR